METSISSKVTSSDSIHDPIDGPVTIEVINVPIMPAPITFPISDQDAIERNDAEPLGLQVETSVGSGDDMDDCKPKPVRRRRVKSKPTAAKSESEVRSFEA